jgi:hypothetical protein
MHELLVLSHSNPTTTDPKFQKCTRIHGLLLSFCNSFVLNELPYNALKESWKTIGEHAVSVVTAIRDCGILNADVSAYNCIAQGAEFESGTRYQPFVISLGHARLHGPDESDEGWESLNCTEGEANDMGGRWR